MLSVYVAGVLGVVGGFRLLSLAWNAMEELPLGVGRVATKIREGWVDASWQSKILQLATPAIMLTAGTLLLSQHIQLRGAGRVTKASEWEPSVGEWALGYVQEGTYGAEQVVMSPKTKRQNRVVSLTGSDPRLRKMVNDTNLSPQEAMSRLEINAETNKKPKIIVMQDQHDGDIMGVVGIPSGADVAAIKAASEPYSVMAIANMVKLGAINYNDYEEWYY
jgi:hypothetical protein